MSCQNPKPCKFCEGGNGHPNPSPMDAVDSAQQDQIDSLQSNSRFMFILLLIGALASVAQIVECVLVYLHGGELK